VYFQPVTIACEPCPDRCIFVVGGVVLDENSALSAIVVRDLAEEGKVTLGVEYTVAAVEELCAVQLDGAQDLDALALPGDLDLGLVADKAPGCMKG